MLEPDALVRVIQRSDAFNAVFRLIRQSQTQVFIHLYKRLLFLDPETGPQALPPLLLCFL